MVSVILVVHQSYLMYLPTVLHSLKDQLEGHELIIVANGCQVDMPEAISIPETNLATACNIGVNASNGEYIVRIDADDWVDAEFIQLESEYLDSHPETDAVWCDYIAAHQQPTDSGEGCEIFTLENMPQPVLEHACGAMYRRSVFDHLGGYDEELEFQEGYDFWQRFYKAGYIADHLTKPLYIYRRGHASMSTNVQERQKVRKMLEERYK